MMYDMAKNLVAEADVLSGKVDAILITGGMANSKYVVERLKRRISFLAPVSVYPGQEEMLAMAHNAIVELDSAKKSD